MIDWLIDRLLYNFFSLWLWLFNCPGQAVCCQAVLFFGLLLDELYLKISKCLKTYIILRKSNRNSNQSPFEEIWIIRQKSCKETSFVEEDTVSETSFCEWIWQLESRWLGKSFIFWRIDFWIELPSPPSCQASKTRTIQSPVHLTNSKTASESDVMGLLYGDQQRRPLLSSPRCSCLSRLTEAVDPHEYPGMWIFFARFSALSQSEKGHFVACWSRCACYRMAWKLTGSQSDWEFVATVENFCFSRSTKIVDWAERIRSTALVSINNSWLLPKSFELYEKPNSSREEKCHPTKY